jgi:hypothetical protein
VSRMASKIAGWSVLAGVPALLIVFVGAALLWWNGLAFQAVSCVQAGIPPSFRQARRQAGVPAEDGRGLGERVDPF